LIDLKEWEDSRKIDEIKLAPGKGCLQGVLRAGHGFFHVKKVDKEGILFYLR
jgi:hypothetical protein